MNQINHQINHQVSHQINHMDHRNPIDAARHATAPAQGQSRRDYERVETAIAFILARRAERPDLDPVAAHIGLSPFHFQRLFKRWAGVSPKQFAGFLTVEYAKAALERSRSVLATSFDGGLSGGARLHDAFVSVEAMSPGAYKAAGRDLEIRYGVHATPFGRALLLMTDRGVCGLEFVTDGDAEALHAAQARWPLSRMQPSPVETAAMIRAIFAEEAKVPLLLRGTNFQLQVWSALLRIPSGAIVSYGTIAHAIGQPRASRAVGTALAQNSVGYLVPCHRVLRATGLFERYRWGAPRRWAMLAREAAAASDAPIG